MVPGSFLGPDGKRLRFGRHPLFGLIGPSVRFSILMRDEFTCRYCGRSAPDVVLHVDHIIPRAKGGTNARENLVTACRECNLGKGAK